MNTYYDTIDSPIGTLTVISKGTALTGLYMEGRGTGEWRQSEGRTLAEEGRDVGGLGIGDQGSGHPAIDPEWIHNGDVEPIQSAKNQLDRYFAGELKEFDIPLALEGTPFQESVWNQLCRIPYGTTISYGELAARVGNPNSSRAVGLANGRNPISIIVPCHRVIGASGKLVGYGGGLDRKIWLLELERGAENLLNVTH